MAPAKMAVVSALEYSLAILTLWLLSMGILDLLGSVFSLAIRPAGKRLPVLPKLETQSFPVPDRF